MAKSNNPAPVTFRAPGATHPLNLVYFAGALAGTWTLNQGFANKTVPALLEIGMATTILLTTPETVTGTRNISLGVLGGGVVSLFEELRHPGV